MSSWYRNITPVYIQNKYAVSSVYTIELFVFMISSDN